MRLSAVAYNLRRVLAAGIVGSFLPGCMTAPEMPRRVSVAEVVANARCELYEAVQINAPRYPWIKYWAAAFDLSFVVDRDANASTDTTNIIPITLGTFSAGFRANLKQKARGTYVVKYQLTKGLGKYHEAGCLDAASSLGQGRLLSGEIGLRRWINEVAPQINEARIENAVKDEPQHVKARREYSGEATGLSYTIEFAIAADGTLLPSWRLAYPDSRQFNPGFNFSLSEVVTHKLIVGLTPIAVPKVEAEDQTAIVKVVGGKKVIVGRRVCVINGDQSNDCLDDLASLEATKDAVRSAKAQESVARNMFENVNSQLETATEGIVELKSKRPDEFMGFDLKTVSKITDTQRRELLAIQEKLIKAEGDLTAAEAQTRSAKRELDEAKNAPVRAMQSQSVLQDQAAVAAQDETARRLEMLIQQQVIRDAFRAGL